MGMGNMAASPNDLRRYYRNKLAELTRNSLDRGILRQGMVVARQTIATYIEVVVQ